ncbi:MAG: J domain-containing protein [Veillonellales bacterium]
MTDYYQVLGIDRSATEQEIKSAYRKLAMQHHPDRGGDAGEFQKVSEAYATLSDAQRRAEYDNPQPQSQHNFGGFPPGFEEMFGHASPFGDIFGFRRRTPTNHSLQLSATITLEEAFYGKDVYATINLPSGREQTINIKIPPGVHDGTVLKLSEMGDDSIPNIPRGDLLLNIQIQNHPVFYRSGDDLIQEVEISCFDAVLGKKISLKSIDNRQLQAEIPEGTQNGTILNIAGYGMPNFNNNSIRGRMLLKIKVKIPILTEQQKEQLRNMEL